MNDVPCGTCNLCCTKGDIKLEDGDFDVNGKPRFIVMPERVDDDYILGHRSDLGHCVYLHDGKCAIHNDKPSVCKRFDCRKVAMTFSKKQIVELDTRGYHAVDYWERGKQLIVEAAQHG